jgi:hypothetical protein
MVPAKFSNGHGKNAYIACWNGNFFQVANIDDIFDFEFRLTLAKLYQAADISEHDFSADNQRKVEKRRFFCKKKDCEPGAPASCPHDAGAGG